LTASSITSEANPFAARQKIAAAKAIFAVRMVNLQGADPFIIPSILGDVRAYIIHRKIAFSMRMWGNLLDLCV
jgi:hypothetical protein